MKAKYLLALLPVLLMIAPVLAATIATVTITVVKDNSNLANVYVEVYDVNGTKIYSGLTDNNGQIALSNVTEGEYKVLVYYEGKVYEFKISVDEQHTAFNLSLGTTDWLKANWKLLAIGLGAGVVIGLILFRR